MLKDLLLKKNILKCKIYFIKKIVIEKFSLLFVQLFSQPLVNPYFYFWT